MSNVYGQKCLSSDGQASLAVRFTAKHYAYCNRFLHLCMSSLKNHQQITLGCNFHHMKIMNTLYVINVIAQKLSKAYLGVTWPLALVLLELECRLCLVLKSGCLNHRCWLVRDFWSMAKLWLSIADWWHLISKVKFSWKKYNNADWWHFINREKSLKWPFVADSRAVFVDGSF